MSKEIEGAVVLITDPRNGEFLWLTSEVNNPQRANGRGEWQCICETSEEGESPSLTAWRGIEEELDGREGVLNNLTPPLPLGATSFLPEIKAWVFVSQWRGEPGFTDFSLPAGEVSQPTWLSPDEPFPGRVRRGVFNVLSQLGERLTPEDLFNLEDKG